MSLFKVRDWWSVQCGGDEDFDHNSLCAANIDNNPNGGDKIIVGSHSGILRIFSINTNTTDDGTWNGYEPSDLLLEIDLKTAILQIASGQFLSATDKVHLAVLHSRKLSVYSISATAGVTEHGSSYNILLIYEHNLQRNAHSMVIGPFGQVKGRDFLCVQSLDGNLTFYEQESLAFSRYIPNILLPGPIAYVPHTDSFIVTSTWTIESFRYQVLAIAKDTTESDNNDKQTKGRKVTSDWNIIIGEAVIDIRVVPIEKFVCYIIVMGERNMYALKENGTIWFMKKFDFNPSAMFVYPNETNDSIILLVATHVLTLLVYSNDILRWATQLPFTPVAILKANVLNIQGLLICLSSEGMLCCGYLGTNPSLKIVPIGDVSTNITDYSQSELELKELRKTMNAINLDGHTPVAANDTEKDNLSSDALLINLHNVQTITVPIEKYNSKLSHNSVVQLTIMVQSPINITNLRLSIDIHKSLTAEPKVITIPSIASHSEPITIDITIWKEDDVPPSSTKISFVAVYNNDRGSPRISLKTLHLPLNVFAKITAPTKEAEHVLAFEIINNGQSNINLSEVFSDLYDSNSMSQNSLSLNNGSTLGLEIFGDHNVVTIMTSLKSTQQRFRIQCDSFGTLAFIANELIRRLNCNDVKFDTSKMDKNFIPLTHMFTLFDIHLSERISVKEIQSSLSTCAIQFRAIQKRLLLKLKDRNPTPLNNLDTLLKVAHSQMMNEGDRLLKAIHQLDKVSSYLSASINLTCTLLLLSSPVKYDSQNIIKSIFTHHISSESDGDSDESVAERIELALITILDNQNKQISNLTKFTSNELSMPENNNNLKKYITVFVDRLIKGEPLNQREVNTHKNFIKRNEAILEEDEDMDVDSKL